MLLISKADIIKNLHQKAKMGTTKVAVEAMIEGFLEQIKNVVKEGHEVSLGRFGIFRKMERKARIARNPRTGEKVEVPAGFKIKFIPAKAFKDLLVK